MRECSVRHAVRYANAAIGRSEPRNKRSVSGASAREQEISWREYTGTLVSVFPPGKEGGLAHIPGNAQKRLLRG